MSATPDGITRIFAAIPNDLVARVDALTTRADGSRISSRTQAIEYLLRRGLSTMQAAQNEQNGERAA